MSTLTRLLLVTNVLRWQSAGSQFMGCLQSRMISEANSLPGRSEEITVNKKHTVLGNTTVPPFPDYTETAIFGMGCFWGAEKKFWTQRGVYSTQVGYSGGFTKNPTYKEVCSGNTGHAEVVRVIFDPNKIPYSTLLEVFWESHNPTQGNRQGNDVGSQYRSAIYTFGSKQQSEAETGRDVYQLALSKAGHDKITTEICPAKDFFYAEDYHQQYLDKNKNGYCGLGGTGVACPRGVLKN